MTELIISSFSVGFLMAVVLYFTGHIVPLIHSFACWK